MDLGSTLLIYDEVEPISQLFDEVLQMSFYK